MFLLAPVNSARADREFLYLENEKGARTRVIKGRRRHEIEESEKEREGESGRERKAFTWCVTSINNEHSDTIGRNFDEFDSKRRPRLMGYQVEFVGRNLLNDNFEN